MQGIGLFHTDPTTGCKWRVIDRCLPEPGDFYITVHQRPGQVKRARAAFFMPRWIVASDVEALKSDLRVVILRWTAADELQRSPISKPALDSLPDLR